MGDNSDEPIVGNGRVVNNVPEVEGAIVEENEVVE